MSPDNALNGVVDFANKSFAVAIPEAIAARALLWIKSLSTTDELNRKRREFRVRVDAFIRDLPWSETVGEMHAVSGRQPIETIGLAFDRLFAIRTLLESPLVPPRRGESAAEFFRHWLIDQWGARFDRQEEDVK